MTDAAATTTRERAARPAAAEPTPGAKVQQAAVRAAEGVPGVHELGTPGGRALVRAMGRVPGGRTTYGPGVSVEVGERRAAVDVSLVVEFGTPAPTVGGEVREAVREQVQRDTGLEVVEVNVTVVGLHHPDDDLPPEPDTADAAEGAASAERPELTEQAEEADRSSAVDETDGARGGAPSPTVVLAGPDGDAPDVVVADRVVLADSVVVVDPGHRQEQGEQEQGERRQD